ncbi:MAG: hypothetical protein A3J48_01060 [Candidatus Doudnabacteria bacterium RIFCSPHIGHO2_02_FULL_46_11]|uniref:Uncharacterized protein n=1 Tax=Candidatus Doudnabacteria bacterium RIFCSPHIGHO2_02_FULL_46_11 TaxID=1817832 RepID=A0A1F5P8D0_9BACT|nr:MAG: hypothetical protein A3J48_01060 [Candidatus Doudnabacteria bacterium RIFCSPHIGHO2_02_FULL_46_11]
MKKLCQFGLAKFFLTKANSRINYRIQPIIINSLNMELKKTKTRNPVRWDEMLGEIEDEIPSWARDREDEKKSSPRKDYLNWN